MEKKDIKPGMILSITTDREQLKVKIGGLYPEYTNLFYADIISGRLDGKRARVSAYDDKLDVFQPDRHDLVARVPYRQVVQIDI
ncbi:MAG: hypothetical protein LBL94_03040 [Prevotellaceae bacterium]|jgi:hypothetical protein|nr:hypothetical protein [Prevotellaceae bacterium]